MKKYVFISAILYFSNICLASEPVAKVDSKPDFDISGSAIVSTDFNKPKVTYYDGKNQPSQIKTDQKSNTKTKKDSSLTRIAAGEAEIVFSAKGKLTNGWVYGAKLSLDAMKNDTGIDKMYLLFEKDNFGTIHAGNVKGPDANFLCSGQQLIGGTTGVDGVLVHELDFATGVISPLYVVGYTSKATKISYYTPNIYGFQLGFAITPDTKHVGHDDKDSSAGNSSNGNDNGLFFKGDNDKQKPSGRNNMAFGLTHIHDFENGWKTKLTAVYVTEDTRAIDTDCYVGDVVAGSGKEGEDGYVATSKSVKKHLKLRNASAWHATAMISYKDFSIAFGYLNNGHSRMPAKSEYLDGDNIVLPGGFISAKDGNAGQAWNIGVRYNYDKWTLSGVYHNTSRKVTAGQKTKGNMLTFAVDYLVCPGLKLFAEFDYINSRSCDYACAVYNLVRSEKTAIKKQRAGLIALGAKVCF